MHVSSGAPVLTARGLAVAGTTGTAERGAVRVAGCGRGGLRAGRERVPTVMPSPRRECLVAAAAVASLGLAGTRGIKRADGLHQQGDR